MKPGVVGQTVKHGKEQGHLLFERRLLLIPGEEGKKR
jgi:hypothetical protein